MSQQLASQNKSQQQEKGAAKTTCRYFGCKVAANCHQKLFCGSSNYAARKSYGSCAESTSRGGDDSEAAIDNKQVAVSDVIGSFGWFQLLVLVFSGLRECLVGYDALVMSIILQPEANFVCADNLPKELEAAAAAAASGGTSSTSNVTDLLRRLLQRQSAELWNETAQCYKSPDGGASLLLDERTARPLECTSWLFAHKNPEEGPSLVAEWSLVCQNNWLAAFIQSAYFFGLVTGNLTWGYLADRYGRRPTYLVAHVVSLVFGSLAVLAPTISLFTASRLLSAFGSIGYNIIYSIQIELIGPKHRSSSTILNHLGWGLGVMLVPVADHLFTSYRPLIAMAPLLTLIMLPAAFWLPESPRWLMAKGRVKEARAELLRVAKFNGKQNFAQLEKRISLIEQKMFAERKAVRCDSAEATENAEQKSYKLIFRNRILAKDTVMLAYLLLIGHLFYYAQTINFAYMKNLSTEANFLSSGAGEWLSVIVGALLLKFLSRSCCMSLCLALMAGSFALQSLIDSQLADWLELDTPLVITLNNCLGTVASLLLIFIVLIVSQEVYPTVCRQTGASVTNTLGEFGSTLAPLVLHLSHLVGPWRANMAFALMCLCGILASQLVTRTDDVELLDT